MEAIQLHTEKEIVIEIRDALRSRRVAAGYTQTAVARRAGMSPRTVQNFESKGIITLQNLVRLLFVYRMERRIADSFADRSWWKMDEVVRAEKRVRVRNGR